MKRLFFLIGFAYVVVEIFVGTKPAKAWETCNNGYNNNGFGKFTLCTQRYPPGFRFQNFQGRWIEGWCSGSKAGALWSVGVEEGNADYLYSKLCGMHLVGHGDNGSRQRAYDSQAEMYRILMESMSKQYYY